MNRKQSVLPVSHLNYKKGQEQVRPENKQSAGECTNLKKFQKFPDTKPRGLAAGVFFVS